VLATVLCVVSLMSNAAAATATAQIRQALEARQYVREQLAVLKDNLAFVRDLVDAATHAPRIAAPRADVASSAAPPSERRDPATPQ
jgi:hypothetical protein